MSPSFKRWWPAALSSCALAAVFITGTVPAEAQPKAPVLPIVAPVVDIQTGSADLSATAALEGTDTGSKVRLDSTLLFAKDSSTLRRAARRRLVEVADEIKAQGPGRLRVVGYTDDLGSRTHGLELSKRRAAAVAGALSSRLGRGGYRFTVVGKGEDDPLVPNTSEVNRRKNRRVLVTFTRRP